MTTLQTYAVTIFSSLNAPIDEYYATISLGVGQAFGCILSACLIHCVGKRVMTFFSFFGCGSCFFIVTSYAQYFGVKNFETSVLNNELIWIPMTFLIDAAFFTHAGIRILPWMLVGEVYSNSTRATASRLSGGISYLLGFISNKIFLEMVAVLTLPGTFWFYSGVCFGGLVILFFILPETEGKSLFNITERFLGNSKIDNNVKRKRCIQEVGEVNKGFARDEDSSSCESKL